MIMRTVDVILAFPQLVFALLLLSLLGPKLWLIVLAVGLSHAPAGGPGAPVGRPWTSPSGTTSRRSSCRECGPLRSWAGRSCRTSSRPLMVEAGLRLTYSIVIIAGLRFLGFGQPPPAPNWGTMINENRIGLQLNPWAVIVPRPC